MPESVVQSWIVRSVPAKSENSWSSFGGWVLSVLLSCKNRLISCISIDQLFVG